MIQVSRFPRSAVRGILLLALGASLLAQGGRHLIQKIPVPGDYGWDYLTADTGGRRLYVSHDREVVLLDLDSGAIVGKIPGARFVRKGKLQSPGFDLMSGASRTCS